MWWALVAHVKNSSVDGIIVNIWNYMLWMFHKYSVMNCAQVYMF